MAGPEFIFVSRVTEERPWGSFTILDVGKSFKVKRIAVNPKQKLSLQYHTHRAEHWTVVEGLATVCIDGTTQNLGVGELAYIEKEQTHQLSNETNQMVQIIEVQLGDYLEEDDIVRLEDIYGRVKK